MGAPDSIDPSTVAPATTPAAASPTIPEGGGSLTPLGERFPMTEQQLTGLQQAGIEQARALIEYVDRSPTPYHAVESACAALRGAGFSPLSERVAWTLMPGDRRYVVRDGSSLVAFVVGTRSPAVAGYRVVAAHTDSPTFRLKPNAGRSAHGYQLLGVEPYGGAIVSSWLDRDLSIAGRVLCRFRHAPRPPDDEPAEAVPLDLARPIARIANVAIHLNRKANDEGQRFNAQRHLPVIVGLEREMDLRALIAAELERAVDEILGFDLCLYDLQRGAIGGLAGEFVFCARLDNLASSFAALRAITALGEAPDATAVVALYDHEECGSRSAVGAAGTLLRDTLERVTGLHPSAEAQPWPRAVAASWLLSADMAHAIHPNYADLHDGEHAPQMNRGLVLKSNANQSYATGGLGAAYVSDLCGRVGYSPQSFVSRSDLRCGTTIGPVIAAELGMRTVDVGAPMLSMHSCREMAGTLDVHLAVRTFEEHFRG